jgi:hypothetical protein
VFASVQQRITLTAAYSHKLQNGMMKGVEVMEGAHDNSSGGVKFV